MVIGHQGVGKTSLVKRLLGEEANENEIKSTEGIDFHHLQINHGTGEWSKTDSDRAKLNKHSMLEVLHKYDKGKSSLPSEYARNTDNGGNCIEQTSKDKSATGNVVSANVLDGNIKTENKGKGTKPFQTNLEITKLVREAKSFSPRGILSSPLTIMDFAGQFLYYTTHQTFISWRTIYLLVTDLSHPLGDPVTKDCSNLVGGVNEPCSIQDHVVYWLNSVHSHVFLPIELDSDQRQGDVILVGTHLDVIPKDLVEKRKKEHFEQIRELLKDRPLRYHLVDTEFAVTNIEADLTIDALKKKIVELAQKQDYWGTTIPARWLALENALLKLAKEGKKVIPYAEVEILNESLEVKLESKDELDLFLKFEHELGHCIFFGTEILRAHVMLDPQWLIEGLRIWITSDEFIKKHPILTDQWYNFTKTGRLTEELIELLWSEHPELHEHQKHLLSVMEKLNIIAKAPVEDKQSAKGKGANVPTIVQTAESAYATNRFMKIYCLLVDLGSLVLRQLLNDKAAEQNLTFDQYLLQKKTDIETLQNKKVLLKVHMDIIYPTNGHTDLGMYDIALSSALLMNIFPSIDTKVKQKIQDVRDERNKFTHAKSTKLSHSEYQIKWTKVTTILIDLTNLCHGITITAEIQRGIQQIKESGSEDLKSVFEKYNEDLKRDMDATLDKFDESQKKDIEVRLNRYKEDLENEMEAKFNNYKAEVDMRIENLKVDLKSWLDKQIDDLKNNVRCEIIAARLDMESAELEKKMDTRLDEFKKRYLEL